MEKYQKIPGPYLRHTEPGPNHNKLIEGAWSSPALEATAKLKWLWTEKVNGTNIRVHWDGHKVTYGGRTDDALLPARLLPILDALVPEELFEQKFNGVPVTLYGEGYGAGIVNGSGVYRPDMSFVLFDVKIDGWWLLRPNVEDVAVSMGLDVVPLVCEGPISNAIDTIKLGLVSRWNPNVLVEGLVGTTAAGLLARDGSRLIVKVKTKDFRS